MILFSMGLLELCRKDGETISKEDIEKAKQLFVYTTAIAEEGGKYEKDNRQEKDGNHEDYMITRDPVSEASQNTVAEGDIENLDEFDSYIRILYPHRITQFLDFGKVFMATCQVILILNDYNNVKNKEVNETQYKNVTKLLENLQKNVINTELNVNNLSQSRFNGHLSIHFDTIRRYFNLPERKKQDLSELALCQIRDKIVKDIFKIMQGNPDVIP